MGPENDLSPVQRQTITWTHADLLPIELIEINYFDSLEQGCSSSTGNALELMQSCTKPLIWSKTKLFILKIYLEMASAKRRTYGLCVSLLIVFVYAYTDGLV